jgi:hypothetical protein
MEPWRRKRSNAARPEPVAYGDEAYPGRKNPYLRHHGPKTSWSNPERAKKELKISPKMK